MEGSHPALSSLLRPRYRTLLRMRSRKSCIYRLGTNLSLIVCFAICLCAAAYMDNMMEDILESDQHSAELFNNRASILVLKAVLENRGIASENLLERHELESALQATGHLTVEEFRLAERLVAKKNDDSANTHPDALLYDEVLDPDTASENHSSNTAVSIVFNSESEFIERVDDNKDSVWLLVVVAGRQRPQGVGIFGHVWGSLVHRYSPFGVKMGILDCHRLKSICLDRGLIAVDLVLALPRGGDRIKDSVQFRPFLLQNPPDPNNSTRTPLERSHQKAVIMKTVHNWLTSVLAERVRPVRSVEDVLPVSSVLFGQKQPQVVYRLRSRLSYWLTRSPQPIHFIWLRKTKSYEARHLDHVPLVLSALSVPFTGRMRFWTLDANQVQTRHSTDKMNTDSSRSWPVSMSSVSSPMDLIRELGCPSNATYLLITPESFCFAFVSSSAQGQKEFLSYPLLELYLRFFYPSVDDLLLILVVLVNLSVMLGSAVTAGRFITATYLSLQHSFINEILNQRPLPQSPAGVTPSDSPNTMDVTLSRLQMIQSLVDFARRGWTAYPPASIRQPTSADEPIHVSPTSTHTTGRNAIHFPRCSALFRILLTWIGNFFGDLFYANLILLVAILPVINILSFSYFSWVINVFLWLLRVLVNCSPLLQLRSSISTSLVTWKTLAVIACLLWCLVTGTSTYYNLSYAQYVVYPAYSRRRRRPTTTSMLSGPGARSVEAFWADLTRLLVVSDMENRTEHSTSTTSTSSTDFEPPIPSQVESRVTGEYADTTSSASSPGQSTAIGPVVVSSPVRLDRLEQTRLLRRLNRLHQMLSVQGDASVEAVSPPPSATDSDHPVGNTVGPTGGPAVSSAHIYTWRYLCNAYHPGHGSGVEEEQNSSVEQKTGVPPSENGFPGGSGYPPQPIRPHRRSSGLPSTSSRRSLRNNLCNVSGSDYEGGDEMGESSDSLNVPMVEDSRASITQPTRLRRRRRRTQTCVPTPVQLPSDSSSDADTRGGVERMKDVHGGTTTEYSDSEQSNILAEVDSKTSPSVFPNWPSWVITCQSCVVCRRSFRNEVRLGALPCGHVFHEACVRRWLDTGALHCPLCRWPAYAPHLRQQRQMISQLISTVRSTLNTSVSP